MRYPIRRYFLSALFALAFTDLRTRAAVYEETDGRVVVEAEHFHSRTRHTHSDGQDHHWHIVPDEDGTDFLADAGDPPFENTRGGKYVQELPNGPGGGGPNIDPKLDFKVFIKTPGTYRLFVRWRGATGSDDSFYASMPQFADGTGGTLADWYRFSQGSGTDFANRWQGNAGFEKTDAGGGDVATTWEIKDPGIYIIRLTQREDGAAVDTILFQLASLPAPTEPGPDESRISTAFPPSVASFTPGSGQRGVFPDTAIKIELEDGGATQVNQSSVKLSLNDQPLTPTINKSGSVTTVEAKTPALLRAGSVNKITVNFSDTGATPQTFSVNSEFTVENYPTLPAGLARPAGSVDLNSSGFSGFVHQAALPSGNLPNSTARAEAQLRGLLIDPDTGKAYVNHATGGGNFTDENVINWSQDAPAEIGNFRSSNGKEDEPIPGIPGDGGSNDNIAAEVITYLELPAGLSRLGVNSDDGFRVTASDNPRDAIAFELGGFNGGRGAADTLFSVITEKAGIYPVRLIWYEGSGGANLEFFSVDLATGDKILINDRANAKALKAYRISTAPLLPMARQVKPLPNSTAANAGAVILVELLDQATTVNASTVKLSLNGTAVNATVNKSGDLTSVTFDPPGLLPSGSKNEVTLAFSDNAATPNAITKTWQFTVQDYSSFPVIPPTFRMPDGSVDLTASGFNVRMHQIEVARPGGNNLPAPLLQLANQLIDSATSQPYPNVIDTSLEPGKWTGSTFTEADVINYNQDARDNPAAGAGNFRPDLPIPGIPGTGGSTDNIAMEATTFLELPAGVYRMGVNSDDGFVVGTALNPKDILPLRLGLFDGGRGSADSLFNFVVEESGIYPFSLIWWEGNGGANVEWFIEESDTGQRILINNRSLPNSVKAYRTAKGTRPYVASVTPAAGAFGVPVDANIEFVLADGSTQVAANSIQLSVNGERVTPTVAKTGADTTIKYDPPTNFSGGSLIKIKLIYSDNSTPPSIRTVDSSFTTDRGAIALPAFEQGADGLVVIEAENFHEKRATAQNWIFAKTPAGFSGEGTMYALPAGVNSGLPSALTDSPRVDFKVKFVKTGTHYFWFRGSDGGGNSLHAGIDEVDPSGTTMDNIDEGCCGTRATGGTSFVWVGGIDATPDGRSKFDVATAGEHTLHFWMREGGQIVDKILITTDPNFFPSGAGPGESVRVGGVGGPPPKFNPPTIQTGTLTISWAGTGKLQVADSVVGPWTDAPSQSNPQSIPVAAGSKFYRLRQ